MDDTYSPYGDFFEQLSANIENVQAYLDHLASMQESNKKYKQFQGKIPLIKQEDFMRDNEEFSIFEGPNYVYDNPEAPKIDVEGIIKKLLSDGL